MPASNFSPSETARLGNANNEMHRWEHACSLKQVEELKLLKENLDLHLLFQEGQGCCWVHTKILAGGLPVVSQVCRPVPVEEQIQKLQHKKPQVMNILAQAI